MTNNASPAQTIADELARPQLSDPASLQVHGHAAAVPPLPEPGFAALKADIEARGLQHPLDVTSGGTVLDGRARLRAAIELALASVPVRIVAPVDELEHVLRAALLRRQLTASQRAAVAAMLSEVTEAQIAARERSRANLRGVEVATLPARGERTRDLVAQLAGTSARTAQDVLTVREHSDELFDRVLRDQVSASVAASKVRRALRDAAIPPPPPLPEGPFPLILIDPPSFLGSPDSEFAPDQHYPTMKLAELKQLRLPAADDCVLFLWAITSRLPDAFELLKAWGFTYRSHLVWVKNGIGPGVWLRHQHELLLLATRGQVPPPEPDQRCSSVIQANRGRHSEKPQASYERIEQMYPHRSKLEMFARGTPRPGWTIWGNQAEPAEPAADHTDTP